MLTSTVRRTSSRRTKLIRRRQPRWRKIQRITSAKEKRVAMKRPHLWLYLPPRRSKQRKWARLQPTPRCSSFVISVLRLASSQIVSFSSVSSSSLNIFRSVGIRVDEICVWSFHRSVRRMADRISFECIPPTFRNKSILKSILQVFKFL